MSRGLVILSHGLESGPQATKVAAMAEAARALGWDEVRPDYRDLDATQDVRRIDDRIARMLSHAPADDVPLVLAGSSMGAFASALGSLVRRPRGLYLLAPPIRIPGYARVLDAAPVPTVVVHGWGDELIPAADVVAFAHARRAALHVVDDDHRLTAHVDVIARWFAEWLERL
jgi:predicted alpha/beta-hydrolase family hydrolase